MLDLGDFLLAEGVEKELGVFDWHFDRRFELGVKLEPCRQFFVQLLHQALKGILILNRS